MENTSSEGVSPAALLPTPSSLQLPQDRGQQSGGGRCSAGDSAGTYLQAAEGCKEVMEAQVVTVYSQ